MIRSKTLFSIGLLLSSFIYFNSSERINGKETTRSLPSLLRRHGHCKIVPHSQTNTRDNYPLASQVTQPITKQLDIPDLIEPNVLQRLVNLLTADIRDCGMTRKGETAQLKNLRLPISFIDSADYWGKYVCTQVYKPQEDISAKQLTSAAHNDCRVKNIYDPENYSVISKSKYKSYNEQIAGAKALQIERVNVHNGSNIYDAATWQIAVALADLHGYRDENGQKISNLPNNQNIFLENGYNPHEKIPIRGSNRAITKHYSEEPFSYNSKSLKNHNHAYHFRMTPGKWLVPDPFKDTIYHQKYITTSKLPQNEEYQAGLLTWSDYSPITGDNAWAFLIGPLQADYIKEVIGNQRKFIPFKSVSIQNAIKALHAFKLMQSDIGAIYYAPEGTLSNKGKKSNPYLVSVENNASVFAGLKILKSVLKLNLIHEKNILTDQDKRDIHHSISDIELMIGDASPDSKKKGLLYFFRKYAWDSQNKEFLLGGYANDPSQNETWVTSEDGSKGSNKVKKGVDTTTWVISVLGPSLIDEWFDAGTSFDLWQSVKVWGGYCGQDKCSHNSDIWGVGYYSEFDDPSDSNSRSNEKCLRDKYSTGKNYNIKSKTNEIMSTEWTAGAINTLRSMITFYKKKNRYDLVKLLTQDERRMSKSILKLTTDNYSQVNEFIKPSNYHSLINLPSSKVAFLYSNCRYYIPFGWYANPLPSMASSTWPIFLHFQYNPFELGGSYEIKDKDN